VSKAKATVSPVLLLALATSPLPPQEVNSLAELEGTVLTREQVDALLLDLGAVLGHIRAASKAQDPATGAPSRLMQPHAAIAEKARRIIAFACDQGWLAVASAVLPLAHACGSCAHDIVAAIHASTAHVSALCRHGGGGGAVA
jgi:hypothetical protein